ncbi:hypothetical protein CPB84DRAFT_1754798 [Gymnopilus junonius]|uniref:Uncharacterized protein n=1 Tax=Gymnopilus junonius TaxID=109634 RepID=A0A9P5N7J9_GYMJU|nr:hypothetical protein CPB84DRAFT_1754798 [Gymnopilus junonius]
MLKRQYVTNDFNDEEPQISQALSKHARMDDSSDVEVPPTQEHSQQNSRGKAKGKAKAVESNGEQVSEEEDSIEMNPDVKQEYDEEEFKRLHGEKLEAYLQNKCKDQEGQEIFDLLGNKRRAKN